MGGQAGREMGDRNLAGEQRGVESIVGAQEGCVKVRSIRRKPEEQRWRGQLWNEMAGVPWKPIPGHQDRNWKSRVLMSDMERQETPKGTEADRQVRRMYIKQNGVRPYGATAGCPGCRAVLRGGENGGNAEECRERITKIMGKRRM